MALDLMEAISGFERDATDLEAAGKGIFEGLTRLVEDEIIPAVSSGLPAGFSIAQDGDYVHLVHPLDISGGRIQAVPERFGVYLRLLHDGIRIYDGEVVTSGEGIRTIICYPIHEKVEQIREAVRGTLESFAARYHLAGVHVGVEPIPMEPIPM